ncbi:hypothetical protein, partial [Chryseobacterium sp. SIMBA_028]|uniref:hypothetical protein n=1 Tax=Chryseobacterium sp. SIMBA_028 TaxID=3085771 RepID=UPI00397E0B47
QLDYGQSSRQEKWREERDPILAINHGIECTAGTQEFEGGFRIEPQRASGAENPDSIDHVVAGLAIFTACKPSDLSTAVGPPAGYFVHVLLGSTGL